MEWIDLDAAIMDIRAGSAAGAIGRRFAGDWPERSKRRREGTGCRERSSPSSLYCASSSRASRLPPAARPARPPPISVDAAQENASEPYHQEMNCIDRLLRQRDLSANDVEPALARAARAAARKTKSGGIGRKRRLRFRRRRPAPCRWRGDPSCAALPRAARRRPCADRLAGDPRAHLALLVAHRSHLLCPPRPPRGGRGRCASTEIRPGWLPRGSARLA